MTSYTIFKSRSLQKMASTANETFTITKGTSISIGFAISFAMAVVWQATTNVSQQYMIDALQKRVDRHEADFMRKDEVMLRLEAIDGKLTQITDQLKDK